MADKKSSPKAILVMAVVGWLGAAVNVYRIYTQSQKPDGDLLDAIINTVIFAAIAVFATIQYRKAKQDQ
jgi:tryptophan-rich sensory protein